MKNKKVKTKMSNKKQKREKSEKKQTRALTRKYNAAIKEKANHEIKKTFQDIQRELKDSQEELRQAKKRYIITLISIALIQIAVFVLAKIYLS